MGAVTMVRTRVTLVHGRDRATALLDLATDDLYRAFQNKFRCKRPAALFTHHGDSVSDTRLLGQPSDLTVHSQRPEVTTTPPNCQDVRHLFKVSEVEPQAVHQLKVTSVLPGVEVVVAMPDLHPGNQYPVGCVVATRNMVYPSLVGNDIGCGMALFPCPFKASADSLYRKFEGWAPTGGPDGMGTIGGGNHFAEIVQCESGQWVGERLLLVHSGSRVVGANVLRPVGGIDPSSDAGRTYMEDHDRAVLWAKRNREEIAMKVLVHGGVVQQAKPLLDICHNSVTRERGLWLHRKGAAPTNKGLVVIPGSRGSKSYVVEGVGTGDYNLDSLAHGAGRCLSRSRARCKAEKQRGADLTRTDMGSRVWTTCQQHLMEETPDSYKPIESVMQDLSDFCRVVAVLHPVLTLKA